MNDKVSIWCVDSGGETLDPIPNSAVKPTCGEGSARATWCENSKAHLFFRSSNESFIRYMLCIDFIVVRLG